jgi:hypothetical protein
MCIFDLHTSKARYEQKVVKLKLKFYLLISSKIKLRHKNIKSCKILKIGRDNLFIFHFISFLFSFEQRIRSVDEDVDDIEMVRETEIARETEMVKDTTEI